MMGPSRRGGRLDYSLELPYYLQVTALHRPEPYTFVRRRALVLLVAFVVIGLSELVVLAVRMISPGTRDIFVPLGGILLGTFASLLVLTFAGWLRTRAGARATERRLLFAVKRSLDVCASGVLLLVIAPLLLVLGAVLKAGSIGSPAVTSETRIGRNGARFPMLAFRTAGRPSGALSRSEAVVRLFGMDRAPALLNVLMGDMSLVGPIAPSPADRLLGQSYWVPKFRPGIIGPAKYRSARSYQELIDAQIAYEGHWSLRHDLSIIFHWVD